MITVRSLASPVGQILVRKKVQTGVVVYEQGDCCQSEADEQGISLSPYVHALYSLLSQKRSHRVLMIGCGGGTLATLLARSGAQVTVVDNNPTTFHLAHDYFQMPAQVKCVIADGANYLEDCGQFYDAIVLDAYNGDRIPRHLRSRRFFRLVKRRLDELEGVFLANIYLHHDFDLTADRMIHATSTIWHDVALLDVQRYSSRNAIALAGAISDLDLPTLLVPPSSQTKAIQSELGFLRFREIRLGRMFTAVDRFHRLATARFK